MNGDICLRGEKVTLQKCNRQLWHAFRMNYVNDPMMDETPYGYDFVRAEEAYHIRTSDPTRLYFAILCAGNVIGEIYLKHMDRQNRTTQFGIALVDDTVKGKGYGTEAIKLLADYAFRVLGLKSMVADSVLRNKRCQHVLEKIGFTYLREDADFRYYTLEAAQVQ